MDCHLCKNEATCRFKGEGQTKDHCNFFLHIERPQVFNTEDLDLAMDIAFSHGQSWGQTIERIGESDFKIEDHSKRYAGMKKEAMEKISQRKGE